VGRGRKRNLSGFDLVPDSRRPAACLSSATEPCGDHDDKRLFEGIDMSALGLAGLTVGDYCVIVQIYKPRE
jgi:hypothetical protein